MQNLPADFQSSDIPKLDIELPELKSRFFNDDTDLYYHLKPVIKGFNSTAPPAGRTFSTI